MHASWTSFCLVALATNIFCNGFIIGLFRSAGIGRRSPLPLLQHRPAISRPQKAQTNTQLWQTGGSEGFNASGCNVDVTAFIQKLKALANKQQTSKGFPTGPGPPEHLVDEVVRMAERIINPRVVADWIWSLGKLGFQASIPKQRALIVKSAQQLCKAKGLSGIDIGMSLTSLAVTGFKLSDLPVELREGLMNVIDQVAIKLDPRNLANVLKALGKLGEVWSSLPPVSKVALWQSFERNIPQLMNESYHASLTVHSFGQLGLDSSTLTDEQRQLVFQVATKGINKESPGQTASQVCLQNAMTILGLGKMGMAYDGLPSELRDHMESCLLHTLDAMNEQEVSNVIYAFGQMGCTWATTNTVLQATFQETVVKKLATMNFQAISITLHGLTNMGVKWSNLMVELRKKTEQAVITMLQQQRDSAHEIASSINSLGKMSAPWKSFNPAFRTVLLNVFILLQGKFKQQDVSNFIYGLGCVGTPFHDLSPAFMTAVQKAVHRLSAAAECFDPQVLSNILLGFARMEASWDQLPTKELEHILVRLSLSMNAQGATNTIHSLAVMEATWQVLSSDPICGIAAAFEVIAPTMKSQDVANSMFGLTLMCFDFQAANMGSSSAELEKEQLMWRMIIALVKRFRLLGREEYHKEHFCQFGIFFEWLSGLPGGMELITKELGSRPAFINPHGVHDPTPLHLALSQALPKALQQLQPARQFPIVNEYDGLGGHVLDMDMAVHQNGKLIAFVEVDGPSHYLADGKQLKRRDLLKEYLYSVRYPATVLHRVRNELLLPNALYATASDLARAVVKHTAVCYDHGM